MMSVQYSKDAVEDTKLIIEVAEKLGLDSVYCTIGCHPHDYRDFSAEAEKRLRAEPLPDSKVGTHKESAFLLRLEVLNYMCHRELALGFASAEEIQACGRRVVAVGECGLDYWKNYYEPLGRSQNA